LKRKGYDVRVYNENILNRDISRQELNADVLCLTGLTSTIERAYEIAQQFRIINPSGKVIIGGIHASFNKEEAARFADSVVIGEGESVIIDVIEGKKKGRFIYGCKEEIANLPSPDFSVLKDYKKVRVTPIMTSRGCPFDCNFCSVTAMFGRQYRANNERAVIEELRNVRTRSVFFYDDNFCADKQRSHRLFDLMRRENFRFKWTAQVRCDATADRQLIKKMAETNCLAVYIGFESINPETLKGYNKNQSLQDIKSAIKRFHDYGIKIHGMFVLGSDQDDKSVFKLTSEFCKRQEIDSVQYMILTPLPGTPLFNNLAEQDRLLHKKWRLYDAMHVVFKPKNFTPIELQEGIVDCYKDFYSYARIMNGAINVFYDKTVNFVRSSHLKRYFSKNWDTGILGKFLVRKWLKQNKGYMKHLKKARYTNSLSQPSLCH
jgi:radical SAM superfamily enzyme YgiQ (UPF0313 family)